MSIIHYSTAFNALDLFVEHHNSNTESLSQHVRQAMILTTREIIKIYSLSLLKANSIAPVDLQNLPPLRTNNVQLAKKANASTRTIQRHLKRLKEAKIIVAKKWRGSKADYELHINPKILLVTGKLGVNISKTNLQERQKLKTENQLLRQKQTTTCPHTDTSNNSYINNILIGVNKLKNTRASFEKRNSLPLISKVETRNANSNAFSGYTREKSAKKIIDARGKACSERATAQTGAENSSENLARHASLSFYVNSLWRLAKNTIYKDVYLTENQDEKAKKLLFQWYEPVQDSQLAKVHQVYVERIGIVQKYLSKNPENRYVQLPDRYFDTKNPHGFTGTKIWYNKQLKRQNEVKLQLILQAQIRRFVKNEQKDTANQKPRLALFKQCETRLGKLGEPQLLQQFHASVLSQSTFKFLN